MRALSLDLSDRTPIQDAHAPYQSEVMKKDQPSLLRNVVVGLGIAEATALVAFMALMQGSTDPLAKAIGWGMTKIAAALLVTLVVPGLALGLGNHRLGWALAILILAVPVSVFLWAYA